MDDDIRNCYYLGLVLMEWRALHCGKSVFQSNAVSLIFSSFLQLFQDG
jgi:hypothetical protein